MAIKPGVPAEKPNNRMIFGNSFIRQRHIKQVLFLVTAVILTIENQDFSALSDFYGDDLTKNDIFDLAIKLWKRLWSSKPANQPPATLAKLNSVL